MVVFVPFLVSLVGVVFYLGVSNPKLSEAGRAAYWVGLLVGLLDLSRASLSFLR
jgi:hypothetical protein